MSCLLFASNRSYLKFPLHIFYRHLSTIQHQNYDHLLLTNTHANSLRCDKSSNLKQPTLCRINYYQKRYVTVHVPPTSERQTVSNKVPFQFPPGNPNDKPKLEHLRFIEYQLKRIVNIELKFFVFI
jgi:hypothetical protein